jgi:hypothetical protein
MYFLNLSGKSKEKINEIVYKSFNISSCFVL